MSYRDIVAWKLSFEFAIAVYGYTKLLPEEEKYGLRQQLRKAAVSIPSNIAEGYGRSSKAEFARFTLIALGSLREVQTQLEICERLGYGVAKDELKMADDVAKVVYSLAQSLQKKPSS